MDLTPFNMLNNDRLRVSSEPPYDPLQAFMRDNHIALPGMKEGALSDLVFAIKDVFKVVGSTYGNGHPKWLETHGPDEFTSSVITKLLEEGADLVGKTVCDELCYSISGENWNYGSPVNPHDPRRLTGGSSSGACAATAGGLVDFALGSDCLGSVRVPASYNGLFGMRPTYQRVATDGEAPYCKSMDVLGYVAREVQTFRKVSEVILGEDPTPVLFKKLLIAEDGFSTVNTDVTEALRPAIAYMGEQVASVEQVTVSPEGLAKWVEVFRIIQGYEVWESYGGWVRKYQPRLSPGPRARLKWASKISLQEYKDALVSRQGIMARMEELVPVDALLCLPTAASVAPLKSEPLEEINANRARSSNLLCISPLSDTPQLTIPFMQQDDVPLGISLIGAKGTDLALATFSANLVEQYTEVRSSSLS